jgi:hypothetical protein
MTTHTSSEPCELALNSLAVMPAEKKKARRHVGTPGRKSDHDLSRATIRARAINKRGPERFSCQTFLLSLSDAALTVDSHWNIGSCSCGSGNRGLRLAVGARTHLANDSMLMMNLSSETKPKMTNAAPCGEGSGARFLKAKCPYLGRWTLSTRAAEAARRRCKCPQRIHSPISPRPSASGLIPLVNPAYVAEIAAKFSCSAASG